MPILDPVLCWELKLGMYQEGMPADAVPSTAIALLWLNDVNPSSGSSSVCHLGSLLL